MEMKICDLPSMYRLAKAECTALTDQLEVAERELDEEPRLYKRNTLRSKKDALIQELLCAEVKAENLWREMTFVKTAVTRNEQKVLMVTIMS